MGMQQLADSLNFFVESETFLAPTGSVGSVLTVTASATGTYNGTDFTNTVHKGGVLFAAFTTIAATCTVRLNLQSKDPLSGLYLTIASLSIDGVTASNVTNGPLYVMKVYPGIAAAAGNTQEQHYNDVFSRTMRLQASITATASVGGAAVSFQTGLSKIV